MKRLTLLAVMAFFFAVPSLMTAQELKCQRPDCDDYIEALAGVFAAKKIACQLVVPRITKTIEV